MNIRRMLLAGVCAAPLAGAAYAGGLMQKSQTRSGWWEKSDAPECLVIRP